MGTTMKKRIYSLDFLKIIATICIICHHYQIYTKTKFNSGINFWGGKFDFAYLVELFFVLSGYFMLTYIKVIIDGMSFKEFFLPKYFRFLVPQTLSVIAFAVLDVVYENLYMEQFFNRTVKIWGVIIASFGFSSGWGVPNPKMNGTIWYISVLLICYIILFVLVFVSKKLDCSPWWLFVFMIFLAFWVSSNSIDILFLNSGTARGISSFFWGIILAKFMRGKEISNKAGISFFICFLISLYVILVCKNTYASDSRNYLYTFCLYPFLILFIQSKCINKLFKNKIWGILGNISFEAYIWHFPIILATINLEKLIGAINYSNKINMFILVVISYLVGTCCYYFIEKPSKKYLEKKIDI